MKCIAVAYEDHYKLVYQSKHLKLNLYKLHTKHAEVDITKK